MTDDATESAGVRFPPPLLFGLGLLAGLALDRVLPLHALDALSATAWTGAGAPLGVRLLLGAPFVAAGIALDLWAMLSFRRARTTVLPWGRASFLVPGGPYRFSRNPMYLGMALAYVGLSLAAGSRWTLLLLPIVLVILRAYVIAREERHLEARFGDEYRAYRARVRRWL